MVTFRLLHTLIREDLIFLLEGNKMDIKACPKCGSRDFRMAGIREGTIFGLTSWDMVCEKCNYKGTPILFDSEGDYKAFLKELENEQKPD
jgi:uncharacterized Zn finger protein (UPF0148 family)